MTRRAAAILLAAGKSRRMGRCKQLLPLGGSTVIGRCLAALVTGGVGEIVVVVSEDGDLVAEAARAYPVRIVVNPEPGGDMASSVRAGRDALTADVSGVIVALCDYPLVSAATIAGLAVAHAALPAGIIIPCHRERRGHPLLFPRAILNGLAEDQILRDLVRCYPERVRCLNLDDPGVLIDMDTPEDYRRICDMYVSEMKGWNT
jgi:molybdenum cofactor cytidylyltransferase